MRESESQLVRRPNLSFWQRKVSFLRRKVFFLEEKQFLSIDNLLSQIMTIILKDKNLMWPEINL